MYILPYFFGKPLDFKPDGKLHSLWIFMTGGGTQFWKTDEVDSTKSLNEIVKDYILDNDFKGSVAGVKGNCLLFHVDHKATNISSFYTWPDGFGIDADGWRPFFWLTDLHENPSKQNDSFQFGKSLAEIPVPFAGLEGVLTIQDLWLTLAEKG